MNANRWSQQGAMRGLWVGLAAAVTITLGAWLLRPRFEQLQAAQLYPAPRPLPAFSLSRSGGGTLTNASLQGHWNLVYAGYTHCPDACPTTLALIAQAVHALPSARVQVIFLSVDPARDDVATLTRYVNGFDPGFIGATGSDASLAPFTAALNMSYSRDAPGANGYSVAHSTAIAIIDPKARLAGYFVPPCTAQAIHADLSKLLARAA